MNDVMMGHGDDVMERTTRRPDTRPLSIGVIGYYGFGNLGDEMLLSAIRRFLAPHRVVAFPFSTHPTQDALDRLNGFDYLILGGGGLFNRTPGAPFDTFDKWASRLRPPISVLGLGVEQLDAQYVPAIHCLVEQSDYFIVRDAESKRMIGHPKVQVAPDLTFYQPLPRAEVHTLAQEVTCGVNLRPLHPGVETWIDAIAALPCRKIALPFSLVPTYDDREPLAQLVGAWPEQASLDTYQQLDAVVGTAFHSIIFAIQAGIPAVAINYHPKVRRLMEEVGLADYVLEWDEPQRLPACLDKALAERDHIRSRMASYTDSAHGKLVSVMSEVGSTIEMRASFPDACDISASSTPLVTVFVLCQNAHQTDITRTVASCSAQTYPNREIVLVDMPASVEVTEMLRAAEQVSVYLVAATHSANIDGNSFAKAGDFVTWVSAGARFAEDALALMAQSLKRQPNMDFVQSDYFLTHNGIIDRRISLRPMTLARTFPIGPSFLARHQFAANLWRIRNKEEDSALAAPGLSIHLKQPLFYKPATPSERNIYLAAIAYGRVQTQTAQAFLSEGIEEDKELTRHTPAFEQAFRTFLDEGYNGLVTSDPFTYLTEVCAALPVATDNQRTFARRFVGRANLELAYMHHEQGSRSRTRNCLLRALRQDPALLSNRGHVWLLAETMIGDRIASLLRRLGGRQEGLS